MDIAMLRVLHYATPDALREDLRTLPICTLAQGLVGLAEGASRGWLADDLRKDPDELGRQVAELAWAGLRGVRGP